MPFLQSSLARIPNIILSIHIDNGYDATAYNKTNQPQPHGIPKDKDSCIKLKPNSKIYLKLHMSRNRARVARKPLEAETE